MKNLFLLLLLASIISCKNAPQEEKLSQNPEKYRNGESYRVTAGEQAINLNILRVMESRCPSGVKCNWQGHAGVMFEIGIGKKIFTDSVYISSYSNMSLSNTREFTVDGKTIRVTLRGVTPYPCYQCKNIPPKQEAIIEISRVWSSPSSDLAYDVYRPVPPLETITRSLLPANTRVAKLASTPWQVIPRILFKCSAGLRRWSVNPKFTSRI